MRRFSYEEWSAAAPALSGYNYRQSCAFAAAAAARVGACSEQIGIFRGTECISLANVRVRQLPLLGGGIAYVSGGPLLNKASGESAHQLLAAMLECLVAEYVSRRGLTLRVAPPVEWAAEQWNVKSLFDQLGFHPSDKPRRYRTILVDLTPSIEVLRKNLDQKWRNCLNRAEKNGLTVRSGDELEMLDEFCGLHKALIDRKGFDVDLSAEFYRDVQSQSKPLEKLTVKLVVVDGKPVAGHVGSILGQTSVYLLGASNHEGNDLKASYLLQWKSMIEAKERGCAWYDLGGIDPEANPGVYLFKERMGGIDVTADGPFELRPSGMRASITRWAERLYRTVGRRRTN